MNLTEFINHFENKKLIGKNQYMVCCPSHADKKPSLCITEDNNKILMYCFAGCTHKDILSAINLTERDLFNNEKEKNMDIVEKEYIYTDEEARMLFKVIRYNPKRFSQAQYSNGIWEYNMRNAKYVPYNLPNILKSDLVYFVEGEKDADNLNSIGLVATTTVGGSNGFNKHKKEYKKYFKNKVVYIIPDNDDAGEKYAMDVYKTLSDVTYKIKIIKLKEFFSDLKEKEDISDVLARYGKDKILELFEKVSDTKDLFDFSGHILSKEILEEVLKNEGIKVAYNEVTKDIDIVGLPTEYSSENAETTLPIILKEILRNYQIKASKKDIEDLLLLIYDANRYNPIINLFKNEKWDQTDRFEELYKIMSISDKFDKLLVRKWFWQTVAIVFNGYIGEKWYGIEGVLVLQGAQAAGKTSFCRNIALKSDWFTEGATIDMRVKDSLILATKGWIVELGEVDSTIKKKQADLKSFLSNTSDEIRVPYGKKSIKKPRRTSFCATVNPSEFLVDETGNRRFWVVKIKNIDNPKLKKLGDDWIKQLWLQTYDEIKDNFEKFRLLPEERKELDRRNHKFTELSPCEEELTLKMDFSGKIKEQWNSVEINDCLLEGRYSSPIIGKTISKLKNMFPDFIEIKNTNKGRIYTLPIKKSGGSEGKNNKIDYLL